MGCPVVSGLFVSSSTVMRRLQGGGGPSVCQCGSQSDPLSRSAWTSHRMTLCWGGCTVCMRKVACSDSCTAQPLTVDGVWAGRQRCMGGRQFERGGMAQDCMENVAINDACGQILPNFGRGIDGHRVTATEARMWVLDGGVHCKGPRLLASDGPADLRYPAFFGWLFFFYQVTLIACLHVPVNLYHYHLWTPTCHAFESIC